MRYLVTGSGGFAGRHLTRHLVEAGHRVTGVGRRAGAPDVPGAQEAVADLGDAAAVRALVARVAPDGIFHLAAPETSVGHSWREPEVAIEANHRTTVNLLGAARAVSPKPRVVFTSSAEVLGA